MFCVVDVNGNVSVIGVEIFGMLLGIDFYCEELSSDGMVIVKYFFVV